MACSAGLTCLLGVIQNRRGEHRKQQPEDRCHDYFLQLRRFVASPPKERLLRLCSNGQV